MAGNTGQVPQVDPAEQQDKQYDKRSGPGDSRLRAPRKTSDRSQRVPDLMRQSRGHLPNGGQFFLLGDSLLPDLQISQVGRHGHGPDHLPLVVGNRNHVHVNVFTSGRTLVSDFPGQPLPREVRGNE